MDSEDLVFKLKRPSKKAFRHSGSHDSLPTTPQAVPDNEEEDGNVVVMRKKKDKKKGISSSISSIKQTKFSFDEDNEVSALSSW
jgi:hypothetical protein